MSKGLRLVDPALSRLARGIASTEVLFASDAAACEQSPSGAYCNVVIRSAPDTSCARGDVDGLRMADQCRVVWCSASHLNGRYAGLCTYWFSHLGLPMSLTFIYADAPTILANIATIARFVDEHVERK